MSKIPILGRLLWIPPQKGLTKKKVEKAFCFHLYNEPGCAKCEFKDERFTDECFTCLNHVDYVSMYQTLKVKGETWYGVPPADPADSLSLLGLPQDYEDARYDAILPEEYRLTYSKKYPLYTGVEKVNGVVMADQKGIVATARENDYNGIIKLRPRSGKTIIAVNISCRLKRRTLILVPDITLANQFYSAIVKHTNVLDREKELNVRLCGVVHNDEDFEEINSIVICNYQKFISTWGNARLKKYVHNKFPLVIIDEVHRGNTKAFSKTIMSINPRFKMGLTATVERKDAREIIVSKIVGKVIATAENKGMTPYVKVHPLSIKPPTDYKRFDKALAWLADCEERNKIIVDQIFSDLEDEDAVIIIPTLRKTFIDNIVNSVNARALAMNKRGGSFPTPLACAVHGTLPGGKKTVESVIGSARKREIRVIVGITKMVKEGLDIPVASHLYITYPIASKISPDPEFFQMTQRVCTPLDGKKTPVIRYFFDVHLGVSRGCYMGSVWKSIIPLKYRFDQDVIGWAKKCAVGRRAMNILDDGTKESRTHGPLTDWASKR